jgi:HAD superfamily hydrolase (TIGR01509 family)
MQALVWDVDGTIAETERDGHRVAFNQAFAAAGLPWHWDPARYDTLLAVAGGLERLLADIETRPDAPPDAAGRRALARALHARKNAAYVALVAQGGLQARPGVQRLVREAAAAGVRLAVATTTGRANVEALFPRLFGADWARLFEVRVCAEEAPAKKPDPQAYALALQRLGLPPHRALALEDSPNGVQAARAAGLPVLVTRSAGFMDADFRGAAAVVDDLQQPAVLAGRAFDRIDLAALRHLHAVATSELQ